MAKYLVTGAAGFIGSSLVRALLERDEQVRGIDNFSTGRRENLAEVIKKIEFREADILDLDAMHSACKGVDYVLHQAAIPSVPRQRRWHGKRPGRGARCQGEAGGLRRLIVGLRRYTNASEA